MKKSSTSAMRPSDQRLPTAFATELWRVKLANFLVASSPALPLLLWMMFSGVEISAAGWVFTLAFLVFTSVLSPVSVPQLSVIFPYRRFVSSHVGEQFGLWQAAFHADSQVRSGIWGNLLVSAILVSLSLI